MTESSAASVKINPTEQPASVSQPTQGPNFIFPSIGGVGFILILIAIILFYRHRNKK